METDTDNTRKRKDISSVSELDTSAGSPAALTGKKSKKKKKKEGKIEEETQDSESGARGGAKGDQPEKEESYKSDVSKQLADINKKLSNVLTKDDGFLRTLIKEIFQQLKDDFLHSVNNRIEILEGRLFERDQENDNLSKTVKGLNTTVENLNKTIDNLKKQTENKQKEITEQKAENEKLSKEIETLKQNTGAKINDLEQYSRKNNIRISGMTETGLETAEDTMQIVMEKLNATMKDLELRNEHIDIAHRLGRKKKDRHRQIIVKLNSRMKRDEILRQRKVMKGTDIFISEDLTPLNQQVLACIRKKLPDEVDQAWSKSGRLYYKLKSDTDTII